MQLSVNYSQALLDIIQTGEIRIDAIEWADKLGQDLIRKTRSTLPALAFHLHPGRMRFSRSGCTHLNDYLALCPQSPHISIHLAPLPILITYPALHWDIHLPGPNPTNAVRRFIHQVLDLKQRLKLPVILENMPALHPTRYRFESEPGVIRQVLEDTDCALLLDLAHARIAAEVRDLPVEDYLSALPLEKIVQIHLAGVRRGKDGWLFDAHQTLEEEDYRLLDWTLARTQPTWLTLEYFREDRVGLLPQLNRLNNYL